MTDQSRGFAYRSCMKKLLAAGLSHPLVARGAAVAGVLAVNAAVLAQGASALRPPTPGKPETPGLVMQILFAALGVALVAGTFLIKAKRGHQD